MVSARDQAKRALVTLLGSLAMTYTCTVNVSRDSPDEDVKKAYRVVARKVNHKDRGGSEEAQKKLSAAHTAWSTALNAQPVRGRPTAAAANARPKAQARPAPSRRGGLQPSF